MMETFRRAHDHKGAAFVEIYQNCNVFNDGAFEAITGKDEPRRHAHPARARRADPLRRRRREGRGPRQRRASPRSSTSPTSARTRILVHDEARDDPGLALHAVAPGRGPARADADRRVPCRRAPRVRRRGDAASSPAAAGAEGPRRPRARSCTPAPPGRSTERSSDDSGPGGSRSERGGTPTPVLGLGWKNVVFGGMRSPPWAMSTICATVAGPQQHAGLGVAARDRRRARCRRRAGTSSSCVGERGRARRRGGWSRGRGRRPCASGRGREQPRRRRRVTRTSAPCSAMRVGDRRASTAPAGVDLEARRRARRRRSKPSGRPDEQAVDGQHGELVLDQLDDERQHARRSRRSAAGRGASLVAVGERGLVAVVAVGDHDRR